MRNAMLAILALTAGAATMAGSGPAAAIEYPFCLQGGGWGYPGECSYRSYAGRDGDGLIGTIAAAITGNTEKR